MDLEPFQVTMGAITPIMTFVTRVITGAFYRRGFLGVKRGIPGFFSAWVSLGARFAFLVRGAKGSAKLENNDQIWDWKKRTAVDKESTKRTEKVRASSTKKGCADQML